jgi:uncharacterized iron-regulated membrane protein
LNVTRQFWVIVHRWAGLTLAGFLVIAGLTGALLAFLDELEAFWAPQLHLAAPPAANAQPLDPVELRERVLAQYPGAVINYLPLNIEPGRSVRFSLERMDPATGQLGAWSADVDQVFVDPYTGRILGQRMWGDIAQGAINLMPFIYKIHYTLAAGVIGHYLLGVAALIWTLDCFIGFFLTFPPARRDNSPESVRQNFRRWWWRWKPSWLVRWNSGQHKVTFDLHRAGGLWLWPLLLVFAWSGVAFNLTEVYDPVMKLFGQERIQDDIAPLPTPRYTPMLDFKAAVATARELAQREASQQGIALQSHGRPGLYYRSDVGAYVYYFTTDRDFTSRGGRSVLVFDGNNGGLLKLTLPQGQNGADTFTNWILALHMANVWGVPYRIAVCAIGLMVTLLSATGVLIWSKKRKARELANAKRRRAPAGKLRPVEPHAQPVATLRGNHSSLS